MNAYTKEQIINLLEENDKAVTRAVVAIYKRQTKSEKEIGATISNNNIGFNGADARYMSYCAEFALKNKTLLTGKHLESARKAIKKYWKQLAEIAEENEINSQIKKLNIQEKYCD